MKFIPLFPLLVSTSLFASTLTFSGQDSSLDFNDSTGSFTLEGLTISLSANDGQINATSTSLGINASASGDDTDGLDSVFDGMGGIIFREVLTVSFNQSVVINSIGLVGFGALDTLELAFGNHSGLVLNSTGSRIFDTVLSVGETLTITSGVGNGVGISNIELTPVKPVPEPSTTILALLGVGAFLMRGTRNR